MSEQEEMDYLLRERERLLQEKEWVLHETEYYKQECQRMDRVLEKRKQKIKELERDTISRHKLMTRIMWDILARRPDLLPVVSQAIYS